MINPIQQNVVFKGVQKNDVKNDFKGAPNLVYTNLSVRDGYLNAVKDVEKTQSDMMGLVNGTSGSKLNVIA